MAIASASITVTAHGFMGGDVDGKIISLRCDLVYGAVRTVTINLSAHGVNLIEQDSSTFGTETVTVPLDVSDFASGDPVVIVYIIGLSPTGPDASCSLVVENVFFTLTDTLGNTVITKPYLGGFADNGNPNGGVGDATIDVSVPGGNQAGISRGPFPLLTSLVGINYSFLEYFKIPPYIGMTPDWLIIDEPGIGLTSRSSYLYMAGSHSFNNQLRQRGQAQIDLFIPAGDSYSPVRDTPMYLWDHRDPDDAAALSVPEWYLVFSGLIQDIEVKWVANNGDKFLTLTGVSLEAVFDTVYAPPRQYVNKSCGEIVTDLFYRLEATCPVSIGTIDAGATIPLLNTNYEKISDLFDELATTSQFVWGVNPATQEFFFTAPATIAAPFTFDSSNLLWETASWKQAGADYRNRQAVRTSYDSFGHSCEFFVGAGQTEITLERPVQQVTNAWATLSTCNTATGTFTNPPNPGDTISTGIPTGTWLATHVYAIDGVLIDANGFVQKITDIGSSPHESGSTIPTFSDVTGGTVTDGNLIWTCQGPAGLATGNRTYTWVIQNPYNEWAKTTAYTEGYRINANGIVQEVTTAGTSGSAAPSFSTTLGDTTSDGAGSLVWTCKGPCLDNRQVDQVLLGNGPYDTAQNLADAINATVTRGNTQLRGVSYSLPTWENALINAIDVSAGAFTAQQKHAGTGWITALSESCTNFTWSATQTSGGTSPQGSLGPNEGATISLQIYVEGTSTAAPAVVYTPGSAVVKLATPLNVGSNLNIEYTRYDGNVIEVENTKLVRDLAVLTHGTGKVQQIADMSTQGLLANSSAAALQIAQQILALYSIPPETFVGETYTPGLQAGMTLPVSLVYPTGASGLLDANWIIDEVSAEIVPVEKWMTGFGGHYRYTIRALNVPTTGTDLDFWRGLGGGSGGSGGGAGASSALVATSGGGLAATGPGLPDLTGKILTSQQAMGINEQSGTTYTFLDSDRAKLVTFTNGLVVAGTLPQAGASSEFISGWFCWVENRGPGPGVIITPVTSTIDGATSLVLGPNQGVMLFSDGTNYFTQRGLPVGAGMTYEGDWSATSGYKISDVVLYSGALYLRVTPGGALGGSPAVIQSAAKSGGTRSLAFTSDVTAGNLLVVAFGDQGSCDPATVTDTVGTVYTKADAKTGTLNELAVYYGYAGGNGPNTVSYTSGGTWQNVTITELHNVPANVNVTAKGYGSTSPNTVSLTTTVADCFVYAAVYGNHSACVFTVSGTGTLTAFDFGHDAIAGLTRTTTTAGSYTAGFINSFTADESPIVAVAFATSALSPDLDTVNWIAFAATSGAATPLGVQQGAYTYSADTGTANAYVVTLSPAPSIVTGSTVVFTAGAANTGASTLDVNGAGPVAITTQGTTPLSGGEIAAGQVVTVVYDGTEWQLSAGAPGATGATGSAGPAPSGTGIVAVSSGSLTSPRTITPGSSNITVSNGDGAAGNPTVDVSSNIAAGVLGITIDGGGATPATGSKGFLQVPYACTITGWSLLADQSGSCQITVKKSTYSGFPSTSSIVASAQPALSSAQKNTSTTLTGWTTAIAAGDIIEFNLDSATTVQRLLLKLQVTKG